MVSVEWGDMENDARVTWYPDYSCEFAKVVVGVQVRGGWVWQLLPTVPCSLWRLVTVDAPKIPNSFQGSMIHLSGGYAPERPTANVHGTQRIRKLGYTQIDRTETTRICRIRPQADNTIIEYWVEGVPDRGNRDPPFVPNHA